MFHKAKKPLGSPKRAGVARSGAEQVTSGRFELEHDGQTAYLEYSLAGNILQLIHTEVPAALRGHGLAAILAQSAFEWAREHGARVDVVCPSVFDYLKKHPEHSDLVL